MPFFQSSKKPRDTYFDNFDPPYQRFHDDKQYRRMPQQYSRPTSNQPQNGANWKLNTYNHGGGFENRRKAPLPPLPRVNPNRLSGQNRPAHQNHPVQNGWRNNNQQQSRPREEYLPRNNWGSNLGKVGRSDSLLSSNSSMFQSRMYVPGSNNAAGSAYNLNGFTNSSDSLTRDPRRPRDSRHRPGQPNGQGPMMRDQRNSPGMPNGRPARNSQNFDYHNRPAGNQGRPMSHNGGPRDQLSNGGDLRKYIPQPDPKYAQLTSSRNPYAPPPANVPTDQLYTVRMERTPHRTLEEMVSSLGHDHLYILDVFLIP